MEFSILHADYSTSAKGIQERDIMNFIRMSLMLITVLAVSSCQSLRNARMTEEFDTISKGYVRMIRWQEFDKSTLFYVDEPLRESFLKKLSEIDRVKLVDYRIKNQECWPKKGTAEVTVEWDYYIPPSVKLKTVTDFQKWRYVEEENRRGWLLTTIMPEFK